MTLYCMRGDGSLVVQNPSGRGKNTHTYIPLNDRWKVIDEEIDVDSGRRIGLPVSSHVNTHVNNLPPMARLYYWFKKRNI